MPRKVKFTLGLCPGDTLVFTAAVESLHGSHPGEFLTAVETTAPEIWENNPNIYRGDLEGFETIPVKYELIHRSDAIACHFMEGFCRDLEASLNVRVPLLVNRPHLYLNAAEQNWINQVAEGGYLGRFWVLNAGRKSDYTAKYWGEENYRKLVEILKGKVTFVQVGEAGHHHPVIPGTINLVGKTSHRQLIRLVWHSSGAVGPVSYLKHLAAAHQKPYVAIAGGREPLNWIQYPFQTTLHTLGKLDCCKTKACWKSRTVVIDDGSEHNTRLCSRPLPIAEPIPACLAMISPEEVAQAVLSYSTGSNI